MKKKAKAKLSTHEQKLLVEMLMNQTTRMSLPKSENKGFTDLPLFNEKDRQTNLF